MRSPASRIVPGFAGSSPASALSVVVLPAPFEPSSATTAPAGTIERHVGNANEVAIADFQMLDREERLLARERQRSRHLGHGCASCRALRDAARLPK